MDLKGGPIFIYTALAPFAMELAFLYLQLEQDEKNGFADTADYEHLKKLALDRGLIPNQATHAVGIGKFDVEIPIGSKFSINTYSFISGEQITGKQGGYFYYKMTSEQTGTVKIILINSNYEVSSTTLINTIQNEIDPNVDGNGDGYASIGHKVTIAGVSAYNIVVSCRLILDGGHTFESVLPNLIIIVNNYFKSLNKHWANSDFITVRVAQVTTVLLDVEGVIDVSLCELNGKSRNLELSENEILVLTDIVEISKWIV